MILDFHAIYISDFFLTCSNVFIRHGKHAVLPAVVSVNVVQYTITWKIGSTDENTCNNDEDCGRDRNNFTHTTERLKTPMLTRYSVEMELMEPEEKTYSCSGILTVIGMGYKTQTA